MTTRHVICSTDEIGPGERKIVDLDGLSIGIFNLDGEYYALNNVCPHQLAPLCRGSITGTTQSSTAGVYEAWVRDGELIRCPWHGWEFDIKTGESVFNPHVSTRTFDTAVETPTEDEEYGVPLLGSEPPVETYDVEVEQEMVVVYV